VREKELTPEEMLKSQRFLCSSATSYTIRFRKVSLFAVVKFQYFAIVKGKEFFPWYVFDEAARVPRSSPFVDVSMFFFVSVRVCLRPEYCFLCIFRGLTQA
jgi:hypothetical protein